jgi:hypothetical protein
MRFHLPVQGISILACCEFPVGLVPLLSRSQQDKIVEIVEALVNQYRRKAS